MRHTERSLVVLLLVSVLGTNGLGGEPPGGREGAATVGGRPIRSWHCEILPPERHEMTDPASGARVVFVTTDPAPDHNLYFHQRSWLSDGSMLLFRSSRTGREELFGYLERTGQLVRLVPPDDPTVPTDATASIRGNGIYLIRDGIVYRWQVKIDTLAATRVRVAEYQIADLRDYGEVGGGAELTESCDGRFLAVRVHGPGATGDEVVLIDKSSGNLTLALSLPYRISHLQFSRTQPDLVMYAKRYASDYAPASRKGGAEKPARQCRMWLANVRTHVTWPLHWQDPGELNTHECWWVQDQITFCGGYVDGHSPVRVIDLHTGQMRVIGEGSWWEGATPAELARVNWWHACGDYQGRWVAADNWHGVIALFDARTTRRYILTTGHRTYGHGAHPHVGWNHLGGEVVFTSNRRGNPDVCVAYVPKAWEEEGN